MGEGAIGISLWAWQETLFEEIYLTVFEKHEDIILLIEKFGFICQGKKENGECVYVKNRKNIDYSTPRRAFPFIRPNFSSAGVLPIYSYYHDRLLPYSELSYTNQAFWDETAGNGITKDFIATPWSFCMTNPLEHLKEGNPVFLYRISNDKTSKTYKSCITSFATITKRIIIKESGRPNFNLKEFIEICGNKSIFSNEKLKKLYNKSNSLIVFELVYNGFLVKATMLYIKN